jgi:hypothetical protein
MGTSGAYGGSAGRDWQAARDSVADLVANPTAGDQQADLLSQVADALDWDADAPSPPATGEDQPAPDDAAPPEPRPFGRLVRPRGGVADGPGVGGGGGGAGPGGGGGAGTAGGGRRSRQRAARVGGAVLAAGLAVRAGDSGTLDALGLSLADLRTLGPLAQCARILNALVGSGADIDEAEMRSASSTALIVVLTENLSPAAAVRVFIVEYVMEISVTELGATMRENGTGEVSVQVEDDLRSLVTAQVDQLPLDESQLGPQQLQDALYGALGSARAVLRALF